MDFLPFLAVVIAIVYALRGWQAWLGYRTDVERAALKAQRQAQELAQRDIEK